MLLVTFVDAWQKRTGGAESNYVWCGSGEHVFLDAQRRLAQP
jgi:hypothetical protein